MKKARLLSLILLMSLLGSCGEAAAPADTTTAAPDEDTGEVTEASPFEIQDLGGRTFVILAREEEGSYPCEIYAGEENGDVLNDAIFQRNRAVEEALHVTIDVLTASRKKMGQEVLTHVMSDEHLFDVGLINYGTVSSLLPVEGALIGLESVESLDLAADWWDAASLEAFRLTDQAYVAAGAVNFNASTAIYGLLFNQSLVDKYQLESPYKLVESGKWTMEEMFKMMQTVEEDINGDSIIDDSDQYGLIATENSFQYLLYHTGEELVRKNSEGILEINRTERLSDAVDKVLPVNQAYRSPGNGTSTTLHQYFIDGKALFYQTSLCNTFEMRAMEADYGIIPGPKMDEKQENYASPLAASFLSLVSIPATNPDPEATGILLNALGYYSAEILTPALYESVLPAKLARDEESTRMIDIMNESKLYVINAAFNFGGSNNIFSTIQSAGTNILSSQLASYESAIHKGIEDLMNKLK